MDKQVTLGEGVLLLVGYVVYVGYTFSTHKDQDKTKKESSKSKVKLINIGVVVVSAIFIYLGARYTIEALINIAEMLNINTTVIAMTAVSIGTSLPELVVSINAAIKKKYELALGNVVGSNIFNALVVIGIPALMTPLVLDGPTFLIGIPFLIGATILYVFSGISRKLHNWEGLTYLLIYILFIVKVFNLF